MYATCLFCTSALGRNEAIEHFPVGRKLAFDAAKGRLWVVCPKCQRWNLSPLEIRWEAIEEAERAFRDTRLRASTEHIGLAKLKEGTELVRIGNPQLPEFAAWRYASVFRRRHRTAIMMSTAMFVGQIASPSLQIVGKGVLGALGLGGPAAAIVAGSSALSLTGSGLLIAKGLYDWRQSRRLRALIRDDGGKAYRVNAAAAGFSAVYVDPADSSLTLDLKYKARFRDGLFWRSIAHGDARAKDAGMAKLKGEPALKALGALLPAVNKNGSGKRAVSEAVDLITQVPDASALLSIAKAGEARPTLLQQPIALVGLAPSFRLALEMTLHEADERRALEGELKELEARWRDAEEIAAISDDMFYPPQLDSRLDSLRASQGES